MSDSKNTLFAVLFPILNFGVSSFKDHLIYKSVCKNWYFFITKYNQKLLEKAFFKIKESNLGNIIDYSDQFTKIIPSISNLKFECTNKGFNTFITRFHMTTFLNMKRLYLKYLHFRTTLDQNLSFPMSLKAIIFNNCHFWVTNAIWQNLCILPNLLILHIEDSNFPDVKPIRDSVIKYSDRWKSLECLFIDYTSYTFNFFLEIVETAKNLKIKIKVKDWNHLNDLKTDIRFRNVTKIEIIVLFTEQHVRMKSNIEKIIQKFPNLSYIKVERLQGKNDFIDLGFRLISSNNHVIIAEKNIK